MILHIIYSVGDKGVFADDSICYPREGVGFSKLCQIIQLFITVNL